MRVSWALGHYCAVGACGEVSQDGLTSPSGTLMYSSPCSCLDTF